MTGRPAEQALTPVVGALPPALAELLAAISDTLDMPPAAPGLRNEVAHGLHAEERIHLVQMAIRDVLNGKSHGLQFEVAYLRQRIAARPPRYTTIDQVLDGGEGQ
ncbi:hypothetical protein Sipo8835_00140 [Streptomyces ipomoeae]|uniref:Uncharacterized protein n=1 Tax=Streptomyces ipomoeae TaxID=103232 RepID=A0AAE8W7N8_9ACTN|nr:hypothetical protein [Streptomyces ipomoeae]TQE40255.1 hypothetical protein Sipo8835_00140 [Streptomyces ipomoeae]